MDTTQRIIIKAISWQGLGIVTMTGLGYLQSGSLPDALTLAVSASASGFACFFVHEKIWNAVAWGRK